MTVLQLSTSEFRTLAARVTALAADYIDGLGQRPAFPHVSGEKSRELFADPLPEEGLGAAAVEGLQTVLDSSRPPSPRFFGYVLGSGEPVAALADLLASVLNQNVTAWRSAPAAVALERQLIGALATALGCEGYCGSFCGGGSMANLMDRHRALCDRGAQLARARHAHRSARQPKFAGRDAQRMRRLEGGYLKTTVRPPLRNTRCSIA